MGVYNLRELADELCFKPAIIELFDDCDHILTVTKMSEILSYTDNPETLVLYDRNGSEITFYKEGITITKDEEDNYVIVGIMPKIRYVITF